MTARTPSEATAASAALSAFLRGVERRGAVFAQLQAGDPEVGTLALSSAMASFRTVAARTPFGDWPRRFWALLLASPPLRESSAQERWPTGLEALGRVGRGPRAALLLRLVAHVSEADAAAVLGVSRATYRMALRRALPRDHDGGADEAAWRLLGDASQQLLRDLPPERLAELARLREAALQGQPWVPAPAPQAPAAGATPVDQASPRWLRPALVAVVVLTLAAFGATFLGRGPAFGPHDGPAQVQSETLPPPRSPAATYDLESALLTHPDLDLLLADAEEPALRDPAFHAWLVQHLDDDLPEDDVVRPEREETPEDVDESALEFDDVP